VIGDASERLILGDKAAIENPFFRMVLDWGLFPLVLLSTAATVIASQAVISGAFSLLRQAIQLGLLPARHPRRDAVQPDRPRRAAVRSISRRSIGCFDCRSRRGPGIPKLECTRLGLWTRGHRNDDHHDGPRRSRHAWCLALAVADDRRGPGTEIYSDYHRGQGPAFHEQACKLAARKISIGQRAGGKAYGLHRETVAQIPILQMDQNGVW
jgi:hypothetical protein